MGNGRLCVKAKTASYGASALSDRGPDSRRCGRQILRPIQPPVPGIALMVQHAGQLVQRLFALARLLCPRRGAAARG